LKSVRQALDPAARRLTVGESAYLAGILRRATRGHGLGLGDRACLALAQRLGAAAFTADRSWSRLDVDVPIELIR
jgi:ribonuclease VapC